MAVQKARELMDVLEEKYEVDASVVPHLQRDYGSLSKYFVMMLRHACKSQMFMDYVAAQTM
jgi:hypothetical protein